MKGNKVRSVKSKGAQGEYIVWDSLKIIYPEMKLTKQLGFVSQYDLVDDKEMICVEVKRHKGFSWNELKKLFYKLQNNAPRRHNILYDCFLIFKANQQPWCVMYSTIDKGCTVIEAEQYFGVEFKRRNENGIVESKKNSEEN